MSTSKPEEPYVGRLVRFVEAFMDGGPGEPPGALVSVNDERTEVIGLIIEEPFEIDGVYRDMSFEGSGLGYEPILWVRVWTPEFNFLLEEDEIIGQHLFV